MKPEVVYRNFSREFKVEAVKLVIERRVAVAQAARDQDVHEMQLRAGKTRWQHLRNAGCALVCH